MSLLGVLHACSSRRSRRRDERGVSALELAFIAPGFLLLIFFTMQAALYFYGRNVAIQSAREGVSQLRLAQDEPTYDNVRAGVISNTERFADTVGRGALTGSIAESTYDDAAGRAGMTVSGNVISLVPFLDLTVHEHAEGPVERFQGSGD